MTLARAQGARAGGGEGIIHVVIVHTAVGPGVNVNTAGLDDPNAARFMAPANMKVR